MSPHSFVHGHCQLDRVLFCTGKKAHIDVYSYAMVLDVHTTLLVLATAMGIAVLWGLRTEWRINRLLRGKNAKTLEDTILKNVTDIEKLNEFRKELEYYLKNVEKRLDQSIRGVGTVRFNPFKGNGEGGSQSFATALIDEKKNGVVLSTLFTRDRVGVYAKPLIHGTSEYELTNEEKEAITLAKQKICS